MEPVPPRNFPRVNGTPLQTLPIGRGEEDPHKVFPPVCLQTHWDPTMILRHSMPTEHLTMPMAPRPWTRICMEYTTAGENQPAPTVAESVMLPSGGQFYPPSRYQAAIDNESALRRLDRQLGTCETEQFLPSITGDMFNSKQLLPARSQQPDSRFISELAMPQALLRNGPYPCREEADIANVSRSKKLFNNATKQERYNQPFATKKTVTPRT